MNYEADTMEVLRDAIQRAQHMEAETRRIALEKLEHATSDAQEALQRHKLARAEKNRLLNAFFSATPVGGLH